MKLTKNQREKIAARTLKALDLVGNVQRDFEKNHVIAISRADGEIAPMLNDEVLKVISSIEDEQNITVYHAIESMHKFGQILNLMFVSDYEEDTAGDQEDIQTLVRDYSALINVYCLNLTNPQFSEFGFIKVQLTDGVLKRTDAIIGAKEQEPLTTAQKVEVLKNTYDLIRSTRRSIERQFDEYNIDLLFGIKEDLFKRERQLLKELNDCKSLDDLMQELESIADFVNLKHKEHRS